MELLIEWSEEELNLAAVRAALREVKPDEPAEGEERPLPAGSDLPAGLIR